MNAKWLPIKVVSIIFWMLFSNSIFADFEFVENNKKIEFGGYVKIDTRYVNGNVLYRDFWVGAGETDGQSSQLKFNARETRLNLKYNHGKVNGFIEIDFYGSGGTETFSNSYGPRLRSAYIEYDSWLFGQTWTTLMNLKAIPETLDFGVAVVGRVFNRQGQFRYSFKGLQIALENPETWGTTVDGGTIDTTNDSVPDFIGRYNISNNWGSFSVSTLLRRLESFNNGRTTTIGYSIAGRINSYKKDDIRFQIHMGELGRYVGALLARDLEQGKIEKTRSAIISYRHFWIRNYRSTIFLGMGMTRVSNSKRRHWGVNVINNLTNELQLGIEYGNYSVEEKSSSSKYLQVSARYNL